MKEILLRPKMVLEIGREILFAENGIEELEGI